MTVFMPGHAPYRFTESHPTPLECTGPKPEHNWPDIWRWAGFARAMRDWHKYSLSYKAQRIRHSHRQYRRITRTFAFPLFSCNLSLFCISFDVYASLNYVTCILWLFIHLIEPFGLTFPIGIIAVIVHQLAIMKKLTYVALLAFASACVVSFYNLKHGNKR